MKLPLYTCDDEEFFILSHTNVMTRGALASQPDRFACASLFRCRLVSSAQPHVVSIALSRESHQNQQKPVSADPAQALSTHACLLCTYPIHYVQLEATITNAKLDPQKRDFQLST